MIKINAKPDESYDVFFVGHLNSTYISNIQKKTFDQITYSWNIIGNIFYKSRLASTIINLDKPSLYPNKIILLQKAQRDLPKTIYGYEFTNDFMLENEPVLLIAKKRKNHALIKGTLQLALSTAIIISLIKNP